MPNAVYVLDSSFLIWAKQELGDALIEVLDQLETLVRAGVVVFPRQVRTELDQVDDMLKHWAKRCWRSVDRYDVDASIARATINQLQDVIDESKTGECADPWLIAQAIEFMTKEPGTKATVVSYDRRDLARKKSVRWGCAQMSVPFMLPGEFLVRLTALVRDVREG